MNWRLNYRDSGKRGVRNDNSGAKRLQYLSPLPYLFGPPHYASNDSRQAAVAISAYEKKLRHAGPLGNVRPWPGAPPPGHAPLFLIPGYATGCT